MDAVKEGLKELGRLLVVAVVSYLLAGTAVNDLVHMVSGTWFTPELQLYVAGALVATLKSVDKWLHEHDKDVKKGDKKLWLSRLIPF